MHRWPGTGRENLCDRVSHRIPPGMKERGPVETRLKRGGHTWFRGPRGRDGDQTSAFPRLPAILP